MKLLNARVLPPLPVIRERVGVRAFKKLLSALTLSLSRITGRGEVGAIIILIASLAASAQSLSIKVDLMRGIYSVASPDWTFSGSIGQAAQGLAQQSGKDAVGSYHEAIFHYQDNGTPLTASIRAYDDKPVAIFGLTYDTGAAAPAGGFPHFTSMPAQMHVQSFTSAAFGPPTFAPTNDATPWLLFDDADHAAIISAADHFFITRLFGDAVSNITSEFQPTLKNIPAGFTQSTIVAATTDINTTWDVWGHALTDLQGKTRPAYDSDAGLKYLGYWTDNGAWYYYKYDKSKGYEGTLLALADYFKQQNIPVRYMQLDSWWYYKTLTGPDGKEGKTKNANLPTGEWNRYGGLMEYRAHPDLFPKGLPDFQKQLGMPLITHNRWVDPQSPYRQKYTISGYAGVDPGYWKEIADYIKSCGVETYEQDWLSEISKHSPDLVNTVDQGDAFLDGMANATKADGETMQYCMAMPWDYLEGSRYSNLTTVRVSDDRFGHSRWHDFLYNSRLASALGEWPWVDTYNSTETYNLLLSNLSAGMVGFGDEMGKESRDNLMKAVRADGVIVKPDAPIVPTDETYIAEASGRHTPLVASTYTDHDGIRTLYVFACHALQEVKKGQKRPPPEPIVKEFSFDETKSIGNAYVYDYFADQVRPLAAGDALTGSLNSDDVCYDIVAPVGKSGVAFFGDAGKFVSTGKQRIDTITDVPNQLTVHLLLAPGETTIKLHGAGANPTVAVDGGTAGTVSFDPASTHWSVDITTPPGNSAAGVKVTFTTK
jgi:hypothetical protein